MRRRGDHERDFNGYLQHNTIEWYSLFGRLAMLESLVVLVYSLSSDCEDSVNHFYRNGDITRLGASIFFIIFNLFMWNMWGR